MRRSALAAMVAALAAGLPGAALAATAPTDPPVLTSAPYAFPLTLHWTPAPDPLNISQSVYRATGPCTDPPAAGGLIRTFPGNATSDFTGRPLDGTYCYHVKVADLLTTADGPGVTVSVDTLPPTATVAVAPAGELSGTVAVSGTSADATSGVAASVLHVGAVGACPAGPVVNGSWDTTAAPNGPYEVCNVVTDNAGHVATATLAVTVANLRPLARPVPLPAGAAPTVAAPRSTPGADTLAPRAPSKLTVVAGRAKSTARVPITARWVNPVAADFDHVVAVLNLARVPRGPADGKLVYQGARSSAVLTVRAGRNAFLALYAYDHAGNMSPAARRTIAAVPVSPLHPASGTVVPAPPLLTWKAKASTAYYNVQLFHKGRRVLVDWPTRPSYRIPSARLEPGTYVWFVWPAFRHNGAATTFGTLIGRATFIYRV
jgi:hypothetical protein